MPGQTHTRVVMSGTIGPAATPYEIWSMGLALDAGDFGLFAPRAEAVADALGTWFGSTGIKVSNHVRLREVAFSLQDPNHRQIGETLRLPRNVVGGGGAAGLPSQVALRVSLGSGLRGRSQKGGFYVPLPAILTNDETGLIEEQPARDFLAACVAMLTNVGQAAQAPVVIASQVAGNVPVNLVRVGRRMDVIRRRANAIPESYVAQDVTPFD